MGQGWPTLGLTTVLGHYAFVESLFFFSTNSSYALGFHLILIWAKALFRLSLIKFGQLSISKLIS